MVKTVAFIDVVSVIPERSEKQASAWSKNLAATSRVTTNIFSRVRPSSASAALPFGATAADVVSAGDRDHTVAGKHSTSQSVGIPSVDTNGGAVSSSPQHERAAPLPVATTATAASSSVSAAGGAEDVLASAARDLHAKAKKLQKSIPKWAAPFLSGSNHHVASPPAGDGQGGTTIASSSSASQAAIESSATQGQVSPPMTPEQALLAAGSVKPKKMARARGQQSPPSAHAHPASTPAVVLPATPPQQDVAQLGMQPLGFASAALAARAPMERKKSSQDVTKGPTRRTAMPKPCLKPPSSMFFAELSVFVRMDPIAAQAATSSGRSLEVADAAIDPSCAPATAPVVRGMATERPWHCTEGPPVISQGAALSGNRTPEQEYAPSSPPLLSSATSPGALAIPSARPAQSLAVPAGVSQGTGSPVLQGSDGGHGRGAVAPTEAGGALVGSPPGSPPDTMPSPLASSDPFQIRLKAECSCQNCTERIMHGLSATYTPSWSQTARNKYLTDRAQERKMHEQGMDADMRLALRGLQEATVKWLEGRDVDAVTDADLAQLNSDDLVTGLLGVHLEEDEDEEAAVASDQATASIPSLAPRPASSMAGRQSPSVPSRLSSISPKPSQLSQSPMESSPLRQWPSKVSEGSHADATRASSPLVGSSSSQRATSFSRVDSHRSSGHSRRTSMEFPPPSASAAATAMLQNTGVPGATTSADEDLELKAALATPPLSRRTSFASSTFRALNRRASLESLRHSLSGPQPRVDEHTDVDDAESDNEEYASTKTNAIIVVEQPDAIPMLAAPGPAAATDTSPVPLQTWTTTASDASSSVTGVKLRSEGVDEPSVDAGSDDEGTSSTPVTSDCTSGAASDHSSQKTPSITAVTEGLKRASWAPGAVMSSMPRDSRHVRADSDVNGRPAVSNVDENGPPASFEGQDSECHTETSVYIDARQTSVGHGSTVVPGSTPAPLDGLRITAISEPDNIRINGVRADESTSRVATPIASREQSPRVPQLTLADRRQQRLNSAGDKTPLASQSRGTLSLDLGSGAVASSAVKVGQTNAVVEDAAGGATAAGSGPQEGEVVMTVTKAQQVESRPCSFYGDVYASAAPEKAGWSVESLPIPSSKPGSAAASREDLAKGLKVPSQRSRGVLAMNGSASADSMMEELASPTVLAPGADRPSSPDSTHGSDGPTRGLGRRVKGFFSNSKRQSRVFLANGLTSPAGRDPSPSSDDLVAIAPIVESPSAFEEGSEPPLPSPALSTGTALPSPATPSSARFRAFDRFGFGVRGRRQNTGDTVASSSSTSTSAMARGRSSQGGPPTPDTPLSAGHDASSSSGFFLLDKVRSAEAFAATKGKPKLKSRGVSGPVVPTLSSKDAKVAGESAAPVPAAAPATTEKSGGGGGGWKPRLGRNLSTEAIRDALQGGSKARSHSKDADQAKRAPAGAGGHGGAAAGNGSAARKMANGHGDAHGPSPSPSNGANSPNPGANNNRRTSTFAGAFLATLSQTGGGVGGMVTGGSSAMLHVRQRPGQDDGPTRSGPPQSRRRFAEP